VLYIFILCCIVIAMFDMKALEAPFHSLYIQYAHEAKLQTNHPIPTSVLLSEKTSTDALPPSLNSQARNKAIAIRHFRTATKKFESKKRLGNSDLAKTPEQKKTACKLSSEKERKKSIPFGISMCACVNQPVCPVFFLPFSAWSSNGIPALLSDTISQPNGIVRRG